MASLAWQEVVREVGLHPWLGLDSHGVVDLDPENQDGGRLRRNLKDLEISLLDSKISRDTYEIMRRGAVDYMRGDCWLGFAVKERVSGLRLTNTLTSLVKQWNHPEQLSVESFGEAGCLTYEYLVVRFRYSSHDEFCVWCQILMSALQEIPV